MKIKNKKTNIPVLIIFLIIICGAGLLFYFSRSSHRNFVVTIDDYPVSDQEFMLFMDRNINDVVAYFNGKYHEDRSVNGFWRKNYNGEIPIDRLKKVALEECKATRVQKNLSVKYGFVKDASFQGILNDLKQENARREKVKNSEVLYGPLKYDINPYYFYSLNLLKQKLIEKLKSDGELKIDDQKVLLYYNEYKEKYYKKPRYYKISFICIPFTTTDGKSKTKAYDEICSAKKELNNGISFEEVQKKFNKGAETQKEFDDNNYHFYAKSKVYTEILAKAAKLEVGGISGPFELFSSFYLIQCLDTKDLGYYSLNERKTSIVNNLTKKSYDEYIAKMAQSLNITIHSDVYEKLMIQ